MNAKILESSFVGLAVMTVLLPAPGYAAKLFQNFQKKKMEKVYTARLASSKIFNTKMGYSDRRTHSDCR